jgi:low affinity Fe/Cu permease
MTLPTDEVVDALASDQRSSLRRSHSLSLALGSPRALAVALLGVVIWLAIGVATGYPRAWELVGTIGLPIVTLLALIVLQQRQNHDDRALQVKLDEILRAIDHADERLVGVEDVDESGLEQLRSEYRRQRPPLRSDGAPSRAISEG